MIVRPLAASTNSWKYLLSCLSGNVIGHIVPTAMTPGGLEAGLCSEFVVVGGNGSTGAFFDNTWDALGKMWLFAAEARVMVLESTQPPGVTRAKDVM